MRCEAFPRFTAGASYTGGQTVACASISDSTNVLIVVNVAMPFPQFGDHTHHRRRIRWRPGLRGSMRHSDANWELPHA